MAEFESRKRIRFEHVDAAGIAFYPRYFEIIHQVFEDWFEQGLGIDYRQFHVVEQRAIPLIDVRCQFLAPSYLGDVLEFRLGVVRLGKRSASVRLRAGCAGERRLEVDMNVVHCSTAGGAIDSLDFPEDMAGRMREFQITESDA